MPSMRTRAWSRHGDLREHQHCANPHQSWLDWSLSCVSLIQWLRGSGKSRSDQPVELERFFSTMYGRNGVIPYFPTIAFQSSLTLADILFGVFGLLYTLCGMYTSQVSTQRPSLPTIAKSLRRICQFLALLLTVTTVLNICSMAFMYFYSNDINGFGNMILAGAFAMIITSIAIVSIITASFMS
jgi:hypothetical protein